MNLDLTAEKLNQHKTVELRKLAKIYGIRETGGRPVNSGRKADLIASILSSIETIRESAKTEEADAKPSVRSKSEGTHSNRKQICRECGKRKIDFRTQGRDSTMCKPCFEYAGWENTHNDDSHEDYRTWEAIAQNRADFGDAHVDVRLDEMRECLVCEREGIGPFAPTPAANGGVHKKAVRFEADAKAAGWSALARNGFEDGVSLVTARRGDVEIVLRWREGAYDYDRSEYRTYTVDDNGVETSSKAVKIRNASAARKLLAG